MRTAFVLAAAVLALSACHSDDVTSTMWAMRPCDPARIELATSKGQPTSIDSDASDPRLQTFEVWDYVTTTATTKTTESHRFEWGTAAGRAAAGGCLQSTSTVTVPR